MTVIDFRAGGFDGYDDEPRVAPHRDHVQDYQYHAQDYQDQYDDAREGGRFAYYSAGETVPVTAGISGRITRLLNYLGAVVSVGLMVGLGVWGYRLVTRDVSGVPVIQAVAGEARVMPENPGGELGEDKGLAVNAVPAGTAQTRIAEVSLDGGSAVLTAEDVAMGGLGARARQPGLLSETAPDPRVARVVATPDAETAALAGAQGAAVAADEAGATTLAFGESDATMPEPPADRAEAIAQAVAEAAMPTVAHVLRPQPRPERLVRVASAQPLVVTDTPSPIITIAEAPAPRALEPKAAEAKATKPKAVVAPGATVAQIGAFDSDAIARSEWVRIAGKNGGLFAGKSEIVQKTEKGGRTFWRLRVAGFEGSDDARGFCAKLKAAGTDCIPTTAN